MSVCQKRYTAIRVSRNWAPQNPHVLSSSCSQIDINWACAMRIFTPFRIPKIGFPANVRPPGNNLTLQTDREAPSWQRLKMVGKANYQWMVRAINIPDLNGHFPGHSVIPKNGPTYMANQQSTWESRDLTIRSVSSTKAVCATPVSQLVMVLN